MECLKEDVRAALPRQGPEVVDRLVDLLNDLADAPEELVELTEEDVADVLKPLPARRLIKYFKDKYQQRPDHSDGRNPTAGLSQTEDDLMKMKTQPGRTEANPNIREANPCEAEFAIKADPVKTEPVLSKILADPMKAGPNPMKTGAQQIERKADEIKTEADLKKTEINLSNTEDDSSETEYDPRKTKTDLSETEDDSSETEYDPRKTKADLSKMEDDSSETEYDPRKTKADLGKTEDDSSETDDDPRMTKAYLGKAEGDSSETEDDPRKTKTDLSETEDVSSETEDDPRKTKADLSNTEDDSSEIEYDPRKTKADLGKAEDDPSETDDDPRMTKAYLGKAEDDFRETDDDPRKKKVDLSNTEDDFTETEDDSSSKTADPRKADDEPKVGHSRREADLSKTEAFPLETKTNPYNTRSDAQRKKADLSSSGEEDSDSFQSAGSSESDDSEGEDPSHSECSKKPIRKRRIHFFAVGESNADISIKIKLYPGETNVEMNRINHGNKGYFTYVYQLPAKSKNIAYRYKVKKKKFTEKFIRIDSTTGPDVYQFDGSITESTSVLKMIFGWMHKPTKMDKQEAYIKSMVEHIHLQEDMLSHENDYLKKMRCFRECLGNQSEGDAEGKDMLLRQAMNVHIDEHLDKLGQLMKTAGSHVNPERISLALVLVCLHQERFIKDFNEQDEGLLLSALEIPTCWQDETGIIASMQKDGHGDMPLLTMVKDAMQKAPSTAAQWLRAVPLLHLLRTNTPLNPQPSHQLPTTSWVQLMGDKKSLISAFTLVQELGRPAVEGLLAELTMDQVKVVQDQLPVGSVLRKVNVDMQQGHLQDDEVSRLLARIYKRVQQMARSGTAHKTSREDNDDACSHCKGILERMQRSHSTDGLVSAIYAVGILIELATSTRGAGTRANSAFADGYVGRHILPQLPEVLEHDGRILEIYAAVNRSEGWGPLFLAKLAEMATGIIEEILSLKDEAELKVFVQDPDTFVPLLSKVFNGAWDKAKENKTTAKHMLTWSLMDGFLDLLSDDVSPELHHRFKNERETLRKQIQTMLYELLEATQTAEQFNTIFIRKQQFSVLVKRLKQWIDDIPDEDRLTKILQLRRRQYVALRQRCEEIEHLAGRCNQASCYNTAKELEKCRSKALGSALCDIYELRAIDSQLLETEWDMKIFDDIPMETQDILRPLYDLRNTVFNKHFEGLYLNKTDHASMDLSTYTSEVIAPALRSWRGLCDDMCTGCISLRLVDSLFDGYREKEREEMMPELKDMCPASADERFKQIERFFTLACHEKAAKSIMRMRAVYSESFQGSFEIIENLSETTRDVPLSSMTEEAVRVIEGLQGIHHGKQHMMEVFIKSKELVRWLQTELQSTKEARALVRLFTSSPQKAEDITNASNLESVATVFSPLIYDVPTDAGLTEFLQRLDEAYMMSLENDGAIDKLDYLRHKVDWLKDLLRNQGGEGVNALEQVETINSSGKYKVGNKNGNYKDLDEIIHVIVTGADGEAKQVYNYSKLKDLQSKLMLVGGQNEESTKEVDYFVEILDGVTGVAKTFSNIVSCGNTLFQRWQSTFFCNPEEEVNTLIDFGLSDEMLSGPKSQGTVAEHIKQVRNFMDHCLEGWRSHLSAKRQECPALNHYTTSQIVSLRKGLSTISSPSPAIPPEVFPLLHSVHPHCAVHSLKESWAYTIKQMEGRNMVDMDEVDEDQNQAREEVVVALLKEGFHRELIIKAMEKTGSYDLKELMMWCWSKQDDDKRLGTIDSTPIQREESHDMVAKRILRNASKKGYSSSLQHTLTKLWEQYLGTTTRSVKDLLSIEHLGIMLTFLREKNNDKTIRDFPPYFKQGRPNLVVCPRAEVYKTILSAYMQNQESPFPSREEVLLCTPHMSFEEVQLLLFRAVQDQSKIFMLVHADLLSYEVAQEVEVAIQKITQGCPDYRLVVICCSENQDKSPLVSALFTHRIEGAVPFPIEDIRQYIFNKLQHRQDDTSQVCSVDPENFAVRVVKSSRAGVGKTLFIKRMAEGLQVNASQPGEPEQAEGGPGAVGPKDEARGGGEEQITAQDNLNVEQGEETSLPRIIGLPLHGKRVDIASIVSRLQRIYRTPDREEGILFHVDIPHEMNEGVDHLLFHFIILGSLVDPCGCVWLRSDADYYALEMMPLLRWELDSTVKGDEARQAVHHMLELLPSITCHGPGDSLRIMKSRQGQDVDQLNTQCSEYDQLMDQKQFMSNAFQLVYKYLRKINVDDKEQVKPDDGGLAVDKVDMVPCLQTLMEHCGVQDPSWAELNRFIQFLNTQWTCYEKSVFCAREHTDDALPDIQPFVVKAMLQMSQDFATRSLVIAEKISKPFDDQEEDFPEAAVANYEFKRKWEASPHPYVFFNSDKTSMTFIGYCVDKDTQSLMDPKTKEVIQEKIMTPELYEGLIHNKVNLNQDFDNLSRQDQLKALGPVMGIDQILDPDSLKNETKILDPDEGYVLTSDNVKKMLAIHMRFRCNIPVIVMGESGCGKTYLINFMCQLQKPPDQTVTNRFILKVHGGTKMEDVVAKVKEAEAQAKENHKKHPDMFTVLFLDEVNTTEALGLIKEILCDGTLNGEPIDMDSGLRLVAACNPYKMHSKEMVKSLEEAGLGYRVRSEDTVERFGRVPMRNLVYRVEPLPQSLMPLVWDFGELDENAEILYTRKIVARHLNKEELKGEFDDNDAKIIVVILHASQCFMRKHKDECSLVSLRDLERAMVVLKWFILNSDLLLDTEQLDKKTWALIMTLGVCYHASLINYRQAYRSTLVSYFKDNFQLPNGEATIDSAICKCQERVVREMRLAPTVACNEALKENIFMMVVCMELRIPLFIIGKPGSSKSLARQVLADAMEGHSSYSSLFKRFKKLHMAPYQCSPHSTSEGILGVFENCALMQKDKDMESFVSTVVLDEVGLAEDSPKLPLKTLHHLLEQGCPGSENPEPHRQVGFIGISNWALDPGKNNRGLMVRRAPPTVYDLKETAKDLCQSDKRASQALQNILPAMAEGYYKLYNNIVTGGKYREFFGLRDFYSLVKMLYSIARDKGRKPDGQEIKEAILRNFGGLLNFNPLQFFDFDDKLDEEDSEQDTTKLIRANLDGDNVDFEERYLLLLTENKMALSTLQENFEATKDAAVIFGSSFPKDIDFTKICRTINRIKLCMETGKTVILLNLGQVYESLYDALNQYYTKIGSDRLVYIGLGSQRMKCKVHEDFKLIVMEDRQVVYKTFPIPLINRFEKHLLSTSTVLNRQQKRISKKLTDWAKAFSQNEKKVPFHGRGRSETPADAFIGYHEDTPAVVVLQVCKELRHAEGNPEWEKKVLSLCKKRLLQCATPEAVVRIDQSALQHKTQHIRNTYLKDQRHESLSEYLALRLQHHRPDKDTFVQITTHSRLLSAEQLQILSRSHSVRLRALPLKAFGTEQEFSEQVREFLFAEPKQPSSSNQAKGENRDGEEDNCSILMIQCGSGNENQELIACCRHIIIGEYMNWKNYSHKQGAGRLVLLNIQLPKMSGGCFSGFQLGHWECVHIDELYQHHKLPKILHLLGCPVSDLIAPHGGGGTCPSNRVDFTPLFESCIIPAMSRLKDEGKTSAGTSRIGKLNALFSREDRIGQDFREIMQRRIYDLQCEDERRHQGIDQSKNWLSTVVRVTINTKMLTLAEQVWQYFQRRMTGFIAQIIGFADSNNNLDMILQPDTPGWKSSMWLSMLDDAQITPLGSGDDGGQNGPQEILVKTYGAQGSPMTGCLPFSWVVKQTIDSFPRASLHQRGWRSAKEVGNVLKNCALWKIIQVAFNGAGSEAIKETYLRDFVAMVYKVQTSEKEIEYELVQQALRTVYRCMEREEPSISCEHIFPLIHAAYESIKGRLQIFSQTTKHFPKVVRDIKVFQDKHPDHPLCGKKEMALDILAMKLQIQSLQPTRKLLRDGEDCQAWYRETGEMAPLINAAFARVDQDDHKPGFEWYGPASKTESQNVRADWERMSAVRIFASIVCPPGSKQEKDLTVHCPLLWMDLEKANMKTRETMETVDKVLETIIKRHSKNSLELCICCHSPLVKVLVLPCGHELCMRKSCLDEDYKCHRCKKEHPQLKDPVPQLSSGQQEVNRFKEKCRFYYLELVSTMSLSGSTCPEAELVERLMEKFVTGEVLADASDEDAQDTQTVHMMRTVQLHLLLSSDPTQLQLEMDKALSKEKILRKRKLELALMYVQCIEDQYHNRLKNGEEILRDAIQKLEECLQGLPHPGLNGHKLESIAKARYALSRAAYHMNQRVNGKAAQDSLLDQLFTLVQHVCTVQDISWPRKYLTKLLVRQFGLTATQAIFKEESFCWMRDENIQTQQDVTNLDPFPLLGNDFKVIHEKLLTALVEQKFKDWIEDANNKGQELPMTLALLAGVELEKHLGQTYLETIKQAIEESTVIEKKDAITRVLAFYDQMRGPGTDRDLQNLLLHFASTLLLAPPTPLLEPLQRLMTSPGEMNDSFLPTMPQDHRVEALKAVFAKEWHVQDARGFNMCPNGHPYAIGDCGRPNASEKCPEKGCGATIGSTGTYNQLAPGNKTLQLKDETKKGHILGEARQEPGQVFPERNMSLVQTSLVRLFMHLSLYVATDSKLKDVAGLLDPAVDEDQVADFLWRHIQQDLQVIGQDMGHDDTLLLVHKIIIKLADPQVQDSATIEDPLLKSKESRQHWEDTFVGKVIAELLSDKNAVVEQAHAQLLNSGSAEQQKLLCLVHESDDGSYYSGHDPVDVPILWRYRIRVELSHVTRTFTEQRTAGGASDAAKYPVLHYFLEKEKLFRAVQLIPKILRLQRTLLHNYDRKITRSKAKKRTIPPRLKKEHADLIEEYRRAWTIVRENRHNLPSSIPDAKKKIFLRECFPKDLLIYYLPSQTGEGEGSHLLVQTLVRIHNDLMDELSKKSNNCILGPSLPLLDITSAHLVSYDPDRDLLPIIMTNCTSSLEVGKGTHIKYDFASMEYQLKERMLQGRSRILEQEIEVVFSDNLTAVNKLRNLDTKIKQEDFELSVQAELRQKDACFMSDVCGLITNLDTVIGFLHSVGGDPERLLVDFMSRDLTMDAGLPMRVQQKCRLKHVKALWLLMSTEREKLAAELGGEPFSLVEEENLKQPLTEAQESALYDKLPAYNLETLLLELYEVITFSFANTDGDSVNFDCPLIFYLNEMSEVTVSPQAFDLPDDVDPILVGQCISAWQSVNDFNVGRVDL